MEQSWDVLSIICKQRFLYLSVKAEALQSIENTKPVILILLKSFTLKCTWSCNNCNQLQFYLEQLFSVLDHHCWQKRLSNSLHVKLFESLCFMWLQYYLSVSILYNTHKSSELLQWLVYALLNCTNNTEQYYIYINILNTPNNKSSYWVSLQKNIWAFLYISL